MKTMFLAAIAALSLTVGVAQMAVAAPYSGSQTSSHQGGSDNGPSLMGGGG